MFSIFGSVVYAFFLSLSFLFQISSHCEMALKCAKQIKVFEEMCLCAPTEYMCECKCKCYDVLCAICMYKTTMKPLIFRNECA